MGEGGSVTPTTSYLRRIDDELVEALQWRGDNLDAVEAFAAGYRVTLAEDGCLTLTREHPPGRVEVAAGGWVIGDGDRVYAVPAYVFRSHVGEVPVE